MGRGGGFHNRENRGGFGGRGGMMRGPQGERRGPGGDMGGNQRPAAGDHPFKIFVGGLPRQGADEHSLRDFFGQYGKVSSFALIRV